MQENDYEFAAGLFSGVFGNIAEICFVITAVVDGKHLIAKTALTGSIVSSCLMTFGTCLVCGGIFHKQQFYPLVIARLNAQLLVVSLVSVTLPTAFQLFSKESSTGLIAVSRGSAVVLLVEFFCYLWFFYHTHVDIASDTPSIQSALVASGLSATHAVPELTNLLNESKGACSLRALREGALEFHPGIGNTRRPWYMDALVLICAVVGMVFASIFLLEGVHAPTHTLHLSESFVGLIVMPLVLASVEYVSHALRCRREGIAWIVDAAFGSSIRISLFVFPVAIIVGWATGEVMDMIFDGFQVTIIGLAIFMVNHVIHNEFAHWLEGSMFVASFLLFAIASAYYPNEA
ncbi:hypothetical protein PCL_07448 [Purpureocillium lilacinum]|uniref:Sodium/calcium exchanger membrane region domain-containing protein n=2 Tax=Purpureocillium TaxID=1052105 RepID=A0A2U3DS06_PURLI|nr:hypothetical protein PCL_07448 [Purpureocillium lilacinum]